MDCPEFDELSVWHDGESDAASIDAHIANCGDCQATLDSLERIDGSLLGPAPTAKTLARIQAGCMRELRKPAPRPSPILSMQLVTRLAAMFALVGIALFMRDKLKELEPGVPANLGQPTSAAMINHMAEAPPVPPPAPTAAVVAVSANLPPPVRIINRPRRSGPTKPSHTIGPLRLHTSPGRWSATARGCWRPGQARAQWR